MSGAGPRQTPLTDEERIDRRLAAYDLGCALVISLFALLACWAFLALPAPKRDGSGSPLQHQEPLPPEPIGGAR